MISKIKSAPEVIFALVRKAFSYQEGALALIATPTGVGLNKLFSLVFEEVPDRDLFMPVLIFGCCLIAFSIISTIDFYTGISASKKEHRISTGSYRGCIKSDKLWSSIWKFQGVIMIASLLVLFTYIFMAIGQEMLSYIFQYGTIVFFLVVILYDVHSIGENHQRRYGTKPDFYAFLEDISKAIRKGFINKIKKLF